jgi:hypothetical protein
LHEIQGEQFGMEEEKSSQKRKRVWKRIPQQLEESWLYQTKMWVMSFLARQQIFGKDERTEKNQQPQYEKKIYRMRFLIRPIKKWRVIFLL